MNRLYPSTPGFESIKLKVEWAREHFDRLKQATDSIEIDFGRHGVVPDDTPEGGDYVWRVQIDESRLTTLPLMMGDFVHNLRSALDHLCWSLASIEHQTGRPLPEFPIFNKSGPTRDGFHEAGIKKIWSLPENAKILIERVQPYQRTHWDGWSIPLRFGHPLKALHDLDNWDKHRMLVPTAWWVSGHHIFASDPVLQALVIAEGRKKNGSIVARLPVASGYTPQDVQFQSTFEITMAEERWARLSIVTFNSELYHRIGRGLIPAFERFFDS